MFPKLSGRLPHEFGVTVQTPRVGVQDVSLIYFDRVGRSFVNEKAHPGRRRLGRREVREQRQSDPGRRVWSSHTSDDAKTKIRDHTRVLRPVCRSGHRSGLVARGLRHAGYQVENLDGGMKAWTRRGLPLDPPGGRVL